MTLATDFRFAGVIDKGDPNADQHKTASMISLDVPPGTFPKVEGGVPDHHVTVMFLGKNVDDDTLDKISDRCKQVAAGMAPITGTIGGRGTFPASESSDWKTPVWAKPNLPGVKKLADQFSDLNASDHKEFHPHMTMQYVADGDPLPPPLAPKQVTFTHLSLHRGDKVEMHPFNVLKQGAGKTQTNDVTGAPVGVLKGFRTDLLEKAARDFGADDFGGFQSIVGPSSQGVSFTERSSRGALKNMNARDRGGLSRSNSRSEPHSLHIPAPTTRAMFRAHLMTEHQIPEDRINGSRIPRKAGSRAGQRQSAMTFESMESMHRRLHDNFPDLFDHQHTKKPTSTKDVRDDLEDRLKRAKNNWTKWDKEHKRVRKDMVTRQQLRDRVYPQATKTVKQPNGTLSYIDHLASHHDVGDINKLVHTYGSLKAAHEFIHHQHGMPKGIAHNHWAKWDAEHVHKLDPTSFRFVLKMEPSGGDMHVSTPLTDISVAYPPIGEKKKKRKEKRKRIMLSKSDFVFLESLQKAGLCTGDGPCDTTPLGDGKNWVTEQGGLPLKVRAVAHALMRERGMDKSHAIAIAVNANKRWIGAKNTKPKTKAVSAAATAEWERKKAQADAEHGHHHDDDDEVSKANNWAKWDADHHAEPKVGKDIKELRCKHCDRPIVYSPADDDFHHLDETKKNEWELRGEVSKTDDTLQNFYGWAYITHDEDGVLNVDKSGEFISDPHELEKAAHDFVFTSRIGDVRHDMGEQSTLIESMVFTPEKCEALGIPDGYLPTGWWAGFHTEDPDVYAEAKQGGMMFSIHGSSIKSNVS